MCLWKFVVPSSMCNLICVPCSWHLSYKWMASLTILNFLWCPSLFSFDFLVSFFGVNLCPFLFHITLICNLYFLQFDWNDGFNSERWIAHVHSPWVVILWCLIHCMINKVKIKVLWSKRNKVKKKNIWIELFDKNENKKW